MHEQKKHFHYFSSGVAVLAICLAMTASAIGCSASFSQKKGDEVAALKEFNRRLSEYTELHRKIESSLPAMKPSPDAAVVVQREQLFAKSLQQAREDARQGDIFIPEIRPVFTRIIQQELSGKQGQDARQMALGEGNPKTEVLPKVNAIYPASAPLSSVPPSLLLRFPALPEGLEYRFIGHHLILRDTKANVIVDVLPNAVELPPANNGGKPAAASPVKPQ